MAQDHGKANRVSENRELIDSSLNQDKCECCNKFIQNKELPLCCNLDKIYHLGYCFPLYYHYLKYCIWVVFIVFLISGIFGIFNNYSNSNESDEDQGFIVRLSVLGTSQDEMRFQSWLNLATIIIILVSFQIFRDHQTLITRECDQSVNSPSDYTLLIRGLRGLTYTKEEIQKFLQEKMRATSNNSQGSQDWNIRKIILTYKIKELKILVEEREILLASVGEILWKIEKTQLNAHEKPAEHLIKKMHEHNINLQNAKIKLEEIENRILVLEEKYKNNEYPLSGSVLAIFDLQKDTKLVKKAWKINWCKQFFTNIFTKLRGDYSSLTFKGRLIEVKRAPEPLDILWENLAFGGLKLTWKRFLTRLSTISVIIVSFIIICALSTWGNKNTHITMLISILIMILNSVLAWSIRKFSTEERQYTFTGYHCSVAEMLGLAQFFNTCCVVIISKLVFYWVLDDRDEGCGDTFDLKLTCMMQNIVYQMFFIFLSNAICTPLFTFLDATYLLKVHERRKIKKQGDKSKYTQANTNIAWEGTQIDIAQKYANLLKTMYLTAFYAPFTPLGIPISLVGLIIGYWTDKYMLLRIHTTPAPMGKIISKTMTEYLEWFTFFFALGNFLIGLYLYFLNGDKYNINMTLSTIGLVISLIHIVLPMREIHKSIHAGRTKESESLNVEPNYEIKSPDFQIDYEDANPITQQQKQEEFLHQEKELEEEHKKSQAIMKIFTKMKESKDNVSPFEESPNYEPKTLFRALNSNPQDRNQNNQNTQYIRAVAPFIMKHIKKHLSNNKVSPGTASTNPDSAIIKQNILETPQFLNLFAGSVKDGTNNIHSQTRELVTNKNDVVLQLMNKQSFGDTKQ